MVVAMLSGLTYVYCGVCMTIESPTKQISHNIFTWLSNAWLDFNSKENQHHLGSIDQLDKKVTDMAVWCYS